LAEQGPSHARLFLWEASFHGVTAQGQGRSKKEAKAAAAKAVKEMLDPSTLPAVPTYQEVLHKKMMAKEGDGKKALLLVSGSLENTLWNILSGQWVSSFKSFVHDLFTLSL